MMTKTYPRSNDLQTVYLNAVVKDPSIVVGDFTVYNDFRSDPRLFEKNNVLYHYPINHERLIIGKFCSIACPPILFPCFTMIGSWIRKMWFPPGTIKETSR